MTHPELRALDPATVIAVSEVIRQSIQRYQTQWEQDSGVAASEGRLLQALMMEHWSFASDLIGKTVTYELADLMDEARNAQIPAFPSQRQALAVA